MIFPLVSENDIVIRTPPQTGNEALSGYSRRIAVFHCAEEVHLSDTELKRGILREEHADRTLKTRILHRLYPREIGKALYDLRVQMANDYRIPHGVLRDYIEKLDELSNALQPSAK